MLRSCRTRHALSREFSQKKRRCPRQLTLAQCMHKHISCLLSPSLQVTASLQAEKSVLEAKCDHLAGRVVQVERERAQVEAQLRELTLQHASLDRQHAAVEVKNDHLGDRLREVVEESEDVKRRTGELERKLASVESMRNEALEKLEEMGQTVEQTKLSKVHGEDSHAWPAVCAVFRHPFVCGIIGEDCWPHKTKEWGLCSLQH